MLELLYETPPQYMPSNALDYAKRSNESSERNRKFLPENLRRHKTRNETEIQSSQANHRKNSTQSGKNRIIATPNDEEHVNREESGEHGPRDSSYRAKFQPSREEGREYPLPGLNRASRECGKTRRRRRRQLLFNSSIPLLSSADQLVSELVLSPETIRRPLYPPRISLSLSLSQQ